MLRHAKSFDLREAYHLFPWNSDDRQPVSHKVSERWNHPTGFAAILLAEPVRKQAPRRIAVRIRNTSSGLTGRTPWTRQRVALRTTKSQAPEGTDAVCPSPTGARFTHWRQIHPRCKLHGRLRAKAEAPAVVRIRQFVRRTGKTIYQGTGHEAFPTGARGDRQARSTPGLRARAFGRGNGEPEFKRGRFPVQAAHPHAGQ
jgi:hypothetical protein